MILYVKGADFSSANIGTLNNFAVRKSIGMGASYNIPDSVTKNTSVTWTITLADGYTFGNYSVTMGTTTITPSVSGNVMTITINSVTANITINIPTVNNNISMFTFTINPTPSDATVELTAPGYVQTGNSIAVPSGTIVTWKVSASGYAEQNGTHTVTKTESKNVTLNVDNGVVNLFTLKNSISELLDGGYYRDASGAIYDENSDFNLKYPSSQKIYINGNGGVDDFKLNLQSGKVYRWECVPYFEYGYIKMGPPWGVDSTMSGKHFWFYDSNDALVANDNTTMTDKSEGGYCMQIPDGAVYMRFMAVAYGDNKSRVEPVLRDRLMITEGNTQHTVYVEPII